MHHIRVETSLWHIAESSPTSKTSLQDKNAVGVMRLLSEEEVLSVAGGPEVDVETGGG